MKIQDVCDKLKVDRYTVYQLLNSGKLTWYRGMRWEILIRDLADYIKRNPVTTRTPLERDKHAEWLKGIR